MSNILFDVKRVQLQMVRDRGYLISDELNILDMTEEEFVDYYTEKVQELVLEASVPESSSKKKTSINERIILTNTYYTDPGVVPQKSIYVMYTNEKTASKDNIAKRAVDAFTAVAINHDEAILITDAVIPKTTLNELTKLAKKVRWQVFTEDELVFNPTEHVSVPKHTKLSTKEANSIFKEMGVTRATLPIINLNDPISRYYNYEIGDVIEIERDDNYLTTLAQKSLAYRIVFKREV